MLGLQPFLDIRTSVLQVNYNIKQIKAAFIYYLGALIYFGNREALIYLIFLPDLVVLVFCEWMAFKRNQEKNSFR
jgi:cytochrome c oxidase subunit IV